VLLGSGLFSRLRIAVQGYVTFGGQGGVREASVRESAEVAKWKKSSASEGEGDCIEVAEQEDTVLIRDSKAPDQEIVSISTTAWMMFLATTRR
jgi:hypothetical protein